MPSAKVAYVHHQHFLTASSAQRLLKSNNASAASQFTTPLSEPGKPQTFLLQASSSIIVEQNTVPVDVANLPYFLKLSLSLDA
jgi:hypothetical protein